MEQPHWIGDEDDRDAAPPPVTYPEAVQILQDLVRARRDVRLDWYGGRGPRGDARLVFLATAGIPEHRVRFGSPRQLPALTRVLGSARPLPAHQGLWHARERTITARIVGDYDELVVALARIMMPKAPAPDSPPGRDVRGRLASSGAFLTSETAAGPKPGRRTMRLVPAGDELTTLYPRRFRTAPALALALTGFTATDAAAAQETLVGYGSSYLHEVVRASGVSLRLWEAGHPADRGFPGSGAGKIAFPRERYDATAVALYADAGSSCRDPLEKYLKYYRILECYLPGTGGARPLSEVDQLRALAELVVTPARLAGFLRGGGLLASLSDGSLVRDVPVLRADHGAQPVPGLDYRPGMAKRVHRIRGRIVPAGKGGRAGAIRPGGGEERGLGADLALIRFFAESAIGHWATPLR
ncbi:hypothetical protein [Amycolatopsis samaneae]|uniref:Uncharacterized protein n=1 Tax=Amycolatopsis samaneae TaxID=664691 RepID=A0ABW5GLW8_9PSEU